MKFELSRYVTTLRYLAVIPLILFGLLSILATSGGGGTVGTATGPTVADLAGTWSGTIEGSGSSFSLSMTIDGSGNITEQLIDGSDTRLTGTIQQTSGTIFSYVLSDATRFITGRFIVDASAAHAGFVNEFFDFGVVEKNAGSLPTYFFEDVIGDWSGLGVDFDSTFNVVRTATSNTTVASDFSYTATDTLGDTSTGSFTTFSVGFGVFEGTFVNSSGTTGVVKAFLSTDKTFAATWACDTTDGPDVFVGFPDDCSFFAYTRQSAPSPTSGSIVIIPPSTTIVVPAGGTCNGSKQVTFSYLISTLDALGQPLGNVDIDITLDHAANTTPGGPVLTALLDGGIAVSNVGDAVPYSTTTDASGNKTMSVSYDRSNGCVYEGNMTVRGAGLPTTQMHFTVGP